jgi:hypothetical protein
VKPRHMLTWMLWSAAVCLSPQGHGQVLDPAHPNLSQGTTTVVLAHGAPIHTCNAHGRSIP